jgi:putative membrane protein
MLYLFLQSIVPTVPASFLTFGSRPLYHYYEELPRLWGVGALADMQAAGMVMKIFNGLLLWAVIAIVFFRWYDREEPGGITARKRRTLDRELIELTGTPHVTTAPN